MKIPKRPTPLTWWFELQDQQRKLEEKKLNIELIIVMGGMALVAIIFLGIVAALS